MCVRTILRDLDKFPLAVEKNVCYTPTNPNKEKANMNAVFVNACRFAQSVCAASSCASMNNCMIIILDAGIILLASLVIFSLILAKNRKTVWSKAALPALVPLLKRE